MLYSLAIASDIFALPRRCKPKASEQLHKPRMSAKGIVYRVHWEENEPEAPLPESLLEPMECSFVIAESQMNQREPGAS